MTTAAENLEGIGTRMHELLRELFPLFRSLTGEANRQTFARLGELVPLQLTEVPTGTRVFDWTVPKEWRFRDAYVKDATGKRVISAQRTNLHLVSHSRPMRGTLTFEELRPYLYTLPSQPDLVPYRHTFYEESWGFCLSHNDLLQIEAAGAGPYEVCIDTDLAPGSLTYAESVLPGWTAEEVLFSSHSCHPSLANDNLSGMVVQAFLAHVLAQRPNRRRTFRFLFAPSTLGCLTWLSQNQTTLGNIRAGLVLANLGCSAALRYQRTRHEDAEIDRVAERLLRDADPDVVIDPFDPLGGDERQFGSPGFALPVGALMRSRPGGYPEYHTSADDIDFVTPQALEESLKTCLRIVDGLEINGRYRNLCPHGEPQLGRRGVTGAIAQQSDAARLHKAALWTLAYSDGVHDLMEIAERSDLPLELIGRAVTVLTGHGLLEPIDSPTAGRVPESTRGNVLV